MVKIAHRAGKSVLTNLLLVVLIALGVVQIFFLTGNSLSIPFLSQKKSEVVQNAKNNAGTTEGKTDPKVIELEKKLNEALENWGGKESDRAELDVLGIKKAILEIEYDKVGGKENYDIVTAVQRKSMMDPNNPQNIEAYKKYLLDTNLQPKEPVQEQPADTTKTDTEKVAKVVETAVLEGNKKADIVVVEYSDTECPFCIKQFNVNKIRERLLEKYPDQIAFAFKNSRGVNHKGTELKGLAMLCAKKLGGDDAYIKMNHGIMAGSVGSVYEVARLPDLAKEIGLDATAWQKCVDSKEMLAQFEAETAEAQSFGLTGTPGTLIINTKTGKYDTVSGAYPFETFVQKIEALK